MTQNNRTRAITFRLGAREYEQLVNVVEARGSRSLSEFTRAAVLNEMITTTVDAFLREEIDSLLNSLDSFDMKIRDLKRQLRQLAAKSNGQPS